MIVENVIKDEVYKKLIEYAFTKCDSVMFVSMKQGFDDNEILELDNTIKKVKNKFSDSLLKSRNGAYWGYRIIGEYRLGFTDQYDPEFENLFEVLFFKFDNSIKDYLLENCNLYQWLNPKYPEDLCFFKDGYCWLYSTAHEDYCCIFCESSEEYEYLKSIGIEFVEKKFVPSAKDELYYEEY